MFLLNGCNQGEDANDSAVEYKIYQSYPDYLIAGNGLLVELSSPFEDFTNQMIEKNKNPLIFDADNNGDNDFLYIIYKTEENEFHENESDYDSLITILSVFGFVYEDEIELIELSTFISVFNTREGLGNPIVFGIVPTGKYKRGYPFNDTVSFSRPVLGAYTPFSVSVKEWITFDEYINTNIYIN